MRKSASFFAGLVFALAVAGCNGYSKTDFSVTLNAANEVPPTTETATGTYVVEFDGPAANWTLTISGTLQSTVTAAHIHQGAAGAAPASNIEVYLYDGPAAAVTTLKGSFIADQVTACTTGCLTGRTYDGILADASAHNAYVNVHTTANAGGAIRGNF